MDGTLRPGSVESDAALRMTGLVKQFGGARALDEAALTVAPGSVHGLIGQNGAGKSTLVKILAGLVRPDAGRIEVGGAAQPHLTPRRAAQLGIGFIHQDRLLAPTATVAEALFLGREPRRFGLPWIDRGRMRRDAARVLADGFGVALPAEALIGELSAAQQQVVQVTRALLDRPRILVFDEPTATLVRREIETLFGIIRRLRDQGIAVIYISHHLPEIRALCDVVTVLRNGRDVGTVDAKATPSDTLIGMMVARDIGSMFPPRDRALGEPVLRTAGLGRAGAYDDVSLTVRRGEILGLTGLIGSGAKEVVRGLFGLQAHDRGTIELNGAAVELASPAQAVARGLALVPEDRRGQGVALAMGVRENTTLASLRRFVRWGRLSRGAERRETGRLIAALAIKTAGQEAAVRTLSGGNQQKVVLAKWLSRRADVYLLDEPTVGVDVAAKVEIYKVVAELAQRGAAVLVLSTDLIELLGLCDRILVMYRGRVVRDMAAAETDSDALLRLLTGVEAAAA
jgi:ribose transport system ATP-binding protein